eukprot:jgi/Mesen1/7502/ME000039S06715
MSNSMAFTTKLHHAAKSRSNRLRAVKDLCENSGDWPRHLHLKTPLFSLPTSSSNRLGRVAAVALSNRGFSSPLSHGGTDCEQDDGDEGTQEGPGSQVGLAVEEPHVLSRVLAKLSQRFGGQEPGAGVARIVEALLQLDLSVEDVASIFLRNRPLYNTPIATKAARPSNNVGELVECLLAFGLTRREVGKMFKAEPLLVSTKSSRGWAETAGYLRDELQVARLSKLLTTRPNTLMLRVGKVRAGVEFLKEELGMRKVAAAVESLPSLLGLNVDSLREKAAALREILGGAALGPMLDRRPSLLYVGPAVPAAAFRWLVDTLGEAEARRAVQGSPQLLANKVEALEHKLRSLRATLPDVDVATLLVKSPLALNANPDVLRGTYEWLAGTFGRATAAEMVLRHPRLLNSTAASLQPRAEFLTGAMGRSAAEVAACPKVLAMGLETRLLPRFAALQGLGLSHHFALSTIHSTSDKEFERCLERWKQPNYDEHRRFDEREGGRDGA